MNDLNLNRTLKPISGDDAPRYPKWVQELRRRLFGWAGTEELQRVRQELADKGELEPAAVHMLDALTRAAQYRESLRPEPAPDGACLTCHGKAFIRLKVERSDPRFGRALPCPDCGWGQQRRAYEAQLAAIDASWRLPANLPELAAKPIVPVDDRGQPAPALAELVALVGDVTSALPRGPLILIDGPYGTAKTHALCQMYEALWASKRTAIYIPSSMLVERVFTMFDNEEAAANSTGDGEGSMNANARRAHLWQMLVKADYLLWDEAGRYRHGRGNGWLDRHIFTIVDLRRSNQRTTVMAGNHLRDSEDGLHAAILDRAEERDCVYLSLSGVASGRKTFGGGAEWRPSKGEA
jgi:hypothetical protein